jgi:hypothetical protein
MTRSHAAADWAPLRTPRLAHREHFTAAARLLEDRRVLYDALAFGHPDLMDDTASLTRLRGRRYTTMLLPGIDAISDEHAAAVAAWVRGGGTLILWHNQTGAAGTGARDEEMQPRAVPAFARLSADPGAGKVTTLDPSLVTDYVTAAPGQSGDTLAAAMGQLPSQRQLEVVETAGGKQASPLVWANLWRHGAGPMLSVQLVNYDVDTTGRDDAVHLTPPLTLRLNVSAEAGLAGRPLDAAWVSPDYCGVRMPTPGLLKCGPPPPPFARDLPCAIAQSGLLEVRVPAVQILGVVIITPRGSAERGMRTAAGEARKWLTRLGLASARTPGADAVAAAPAIASAAALLDSVQGLAPSRAPSAAVVGQLNRTAAALKAMVRAITAGHAGQRAAMMSRTAAVAAVRRYDFTGGHASSPPGWVAVRPHRNAAGAPGCAPPGCADAGWALVCLEGSTARLGGCTANHSLAAGGSLEPLTGVESLFGEFVRSRDPAIPYRYGAGHSSGQFRLAEGLQPKLSPGVFHVSGLDDGAYTVTVITGSNGAFPVWEGPSIEGRTAMTAVEVLGADGLAEAVSVGDRLRAGEHQYRAFPVRVAGGTLALRFSGSAVGPLYYNSIQWLVSAVVLQRQEQPLLPEAARAKGSLLANLV